MLNEVVLQGRLTRDPELRTTNSGSPVCNFTLAVERDFKNSEGVRETDFIDVITWRNTAEFVSRNFHKGQMANAVGRLEVRKYQDRDGNTRTQYAVVADNVYFCGDKKTEGTNTLPVPVGGPENDFKEYNENDDELPF